MPMFKAKELCKDLIIVPVDFLYYEVLSNEFIQVISQYSKVIEQASIDECYVDFTGCIEKG
jgi:DNA polymerase-4